VGIPAIFLAARASFASDYIELQFVGFRGYTGTEKYENHYSMSASDDKTQIFSISIFLYVFIQMTFLFRVPCPVHYFVFLDFDHRSNYYCLRLENFNIYSSHVEVCL
jgi:hypothetical protein